MQWTVLWKFFIKYFEQISSNVRGYIFTIWGGGGGVYQMISLRRLFFVRLAGCAENFVGLG